MGVECNGVPIAEDSTSIAWDRRQEHARATGGWEE